MALVLRCARKATPSYSAKVGILNSLNVLRACIGLDKILDFVFLSIILRCWSAPH